MTNLKLKLLKISTYYAYKQLLKVLAVPHFPAQGQAVLKVRIHRATFLAILLGNNMIGSYDK